ncbi:MAG: SCO family protein [Bacteroidetes bacterium]|nr:SCO family protein [Bacteroidota bacterium]
MKWHLILCAAMLLSLSSCKPPPEPKVKVLGETLVYHQTIDGQVRYDTVTAVIPQFHFIDQYGHQVDTGTISGHVYVVDFFFTHCPSICPKMKAELHKVYEKYSDKGVLILSHSIDPERDTFPALRLYAEKLNIDNNKWLFLTGDHDSIYAMADRYLAYAKEDKESPGGFVHDGNFILVDKKRHIRGYYDGTTDEGTEKMMSDIELLLHEK